jgi:hypothetical protein
MNDVSYTKMTSNGYSLTLPIFFVPQKKQHLNCQIILLKFNNTSKTKKYQQQNNGI